jgi:hypothetical protein
MTGDDVTAFLADVRMQAEDHHLVPAHMVLPLLTFADAALKLADDWDAESDRLGDEAEKPGAAVRAVMLAGQAVAYRDAAVDLREAITAALAGTQLSEDGNHG